MFDALFGWLKKLWDKIKPFLAIVLICLAVYFTMGGALAIGGFSIGGFAFAGFTLSGTAAAAIAGAAAFLIDADTTIDVVSKVAEGVGEVASSATVALGAGIIDGVLGDGSASFLKRVLIGGAVLGTGWWLYSKFKDDKHAIVVDDNVASDNVSFHGDVVEDAEFYEYPDEQVDPGQLGN